MNKIIYAVVLDYTNLCIRSFEIPVKFAGEHGEHAEEWLLENMENVTGEKYSQSSCYYMTSQNPIDVIQC